MRIRWAWISAGLLIVAALAAERLLAAPPQAGDEAEIRRLIAAHAAASQHRDLRGLVDVYHADADVRYSDGTVLHGRVEIEKSYREALASDPGEVSHVHPAESIHIRFLRPDVAFVDVESVAVGNAGGSAAPQPATRVPLLVVFTKQDGRWGVVAQRSGAPLK